MELLYTLLTGVAVWLINAGFILCAPQPSAIEERAACNADNVLRTFRASQNFVAAYNFCSQYLSLPPVTTTTVQSTSTSTMVSTNYDYRAVHPLYLYNIQEQSYGCNDPQITYNSAKPSPSMVPGDVQGFYGYCNKRDRARAPEPTAFVDRRATTTLTSSLSTPTFIASTIPPSRISSACSCLSVQISSTETYQPVSTLSTTSSCREYNFYSVTSVAALCAPSLQVNAPTLALSPPNIKTASVGSVTDKLACCAACMRAFNCVWWKFHFGTPQDPWQSGTCVYGYNIATNIRSPTQSANPAICPNGDVSGLLGNTHFPGDESGNYLEGYNEGPCGNPLNAYESNEDFGYPADDPFGNAPRC